MVAIARALLNDNALLLVDEPTKGLAPLLVTEVAAALERAAELATVLLVEQNLGVVPARRERRRRPRRRAGRPRGRRAGELLASPSACGSCSASTGAARVSTFVLLTITGLGLGALYFLVASGLSLIYGLMGVLNFAHGAFITFGAYAAWWVTTQIDDVASRASCSLATAFGLAVGAALGAFVELVFIRPLYRRPVEQVLVTVGLALALGALVYGIWGPIRMFPDGR